MNSMKRILAILVCLSLYAPLVLAQEPQLTRPARDTTSRDVTIIIQQRRLRFTAPASVQEVRLEVFNQAGETVYDSGVITGQELYWALQNASGEAVPGGLYAYTLTIKEANSETPELRRGHLILESGADRLWVTSQGAIGAEASMSGGELTASSGPETSVAGARLGRAAAARSTYNLDFFGTPGRIPMFIGGDLLADSMIWQDFNGRIGIGTSTPGTALLTVAGQIETKSGGIKFPNGTVQTTSAAGSLFQVLHNATLQGNGTEGSPLGVNIPALGLLNTVAHNSTLAGNGTSAAPLGVSVPLSLINSTGIAGAILEIINPTGRGLSAIAGSGGIGVGALGGDSVSGSGAGMVSVGGTGDVGSPGVIAFGGVGDTTGGAGVTAIGGNSDVTGGIGIRATAGVGVAGSGLAGRFNGDVEITGNVSKGGGSFRIDHPLDPANKYLSHSFVESPDMMNVYNGNIMTDQNGEATVTLPDYFEALNREFRYQLTVIGQFAQAIVASEINENRFTIKTDRPSVKVSWQVTGIRQDAYANKHRIPVEEEKSERERGYYLHPQVFKQPDEKSVEWARNPEMMMHIKRQRQEAELRRLEKKKER
ncbi:MAG TPA: hypothetical protein VJ810_35295 [Blastocatellia bacterium]|nr:hypothetical protein [Blastocatellia bacterium]